MKKLLFLFLLFFILIQCDSTEVIREDFPGFTNLDFEYNIPDMETDFDNEVVKLGRVLFYDNILSDNGKVSCASCHQQKLSFGDNTSLSLGFLSGETTSNTISLINSRYNEGFFWGNTTFNIHRAVTQPIFNRNEMGLDLSTLVNRIDGASYYKELFINAYGSDNVSELVIAEALAQFIESIICTDSKFDRYKAAEEMLSESEEMGMKLFREHCNDCHSVLDSVYYTGNEDWGTDIGLPLPEEQIPYYGFHRIRVPSLRNIALTGPYMHDGRFETLGEVIEHYNSGITTEGRSSSRGVDERLLTNSREPQELHLSEDEKLSIIDFLHTLTDESIVNDEKFSSPFAE